MCLSSCRKKMLQYGIVLMGIFLPAIVFGQSVITSPELEKTIREHKGDVVVVAFWATWDKPSRRQILELNVLYHIYKDMRVQFLGVSFDEEEKRWWRSSVVKKFEREYSIAFPLYKVKDKEDISHIFRIKQIPTLIYYFSFGKRGEFKQYMSAGYTESRQIEEDLDNCLKGVMPRSEGQPVQRQEIQEKFPRLRP